MGLLHGFCNNGSFACAWATTYVYASDSTVFYVCLEKIIQSFRLCLATWKLGHFRAKLQSFFHIVQKRAVVFWLVGSQRSHPLRVPRRRKVVRWAFKETDLVYFVLPRRCIVNNLHESIA